MLVLASASPRRKQLLTQMGYEFKVFPANIPEDRRSNEDPIAFVSRLAREKALCVLNKLATTPDSKHLLVLGADTIVIAGSEILGKPRDTADAARMLRLLSGRTHQVATGVSLISKSGSETRAEITSVMVNAISEDEIAAYIATDEPMDKAGAYAIQGYAARWIPRIEGCYFNVVGLPLALVSAMIDKADAVGKLGREILKSTQE